MSVYKTSNGWKVDFRRNRVGERAFRDTSTFKTKSEAQAYFDRLNQAVEDAARLELHMPASTTLSEALDDWWKDEAKASTAESAQHSLLVRIRAWQRSHLGDLPVKHLTQRHIKRWVDDRKKQGRADATLRNDLSVLQSLYKYLQNEKEWYIDNPVERQLKRLKHSRKRDRRLTPEEYKLLSDSFLAMHQAYLNRDRKHSHGQLKVTLPNGTDLATAKSRNLLYIHAAFQAAIECAMRRRRLFNLRWRDIDFKRRVIHVEDTGPENKEVHNTTPMSPNLYKILKNLEGTPRIGDALNEKVFGTLSGDRAYRYIKMVSEALDIQGLTWHDLRHEACSRLADLGWTTLQIQRVSGHKSLLSLQRYTHVSIESIHRLYDKQTGT